ncbi:hypothetical protein [Staphylococcus aureus]|uniref:hypothetical protein n=1 Tax=Staphylococcus aureus TaxID=1280 RepID=UPI00085CBAFC|nr:hypothetical protein [Staphylococcus aureus]
MAGPQQREFQRNSTGNASWGVGPKQREIGFPISTGNASWGVGPKQREIGFPISTDNVSWGGTTK